MNDFFFPHMAFEILVPQLGIELRAPGNESTKEFPR